MQTWQSWALGALMRHAAAGCERCRFAAAVHPLLVRLHPVERPLTA